MISLKLVRLLKNPAEMVNIGLTVNSGTLQMAQKCKHVWVGPGASTYKRWSKCTMEKVGEAFLQKLRGECINY